MGRPKVDNPKYHKFSIRLDDDTLNRLNVYCEKTGKKRAEAIRNGIELLLKTAPK